MKIDNKSLTKKEGVMDPKTRELVAVGASVAGNCAPCLRFHLKEAAAKGCSKEEIEEAIELAGMIKQNPLNEIEIIARHLADYF